MTNVKETYFYTAREKRFVKEYLACNNGAEAARRAGYSEATARTIAHEMLNKPKIAVAIAEENQFIEEKLEITAELKRKMLLKIANRCIQEEPVLDREGNPTGEYQFKAGDAIRALAELNKMQGHLAPTKTENDTKVTVNEVYDSIVNQPSSSPKNAIRIQH